MKQRWKLVAIVSAVWLSIWSCSIALRGSVQQARPVESQEAVQFVAHGTNATPSASQSGLSGNGGKCSFDQYTYPAWPKDFNVSVNALFVIGTSRA